MCTPFTQNMYSKGMSSEALVVYRHIFDIRPSGFFTDRSRNVPPVSNKTLMIMKLLFQKKKK